MRRFVLIAFTILVGSAWVFAASLSDLPTDARAAIPSAIDKDVAQNYPERLSKVTLTEPNGVNNAS